MRILVSAYACDPYLGSEPGAGWAAVCRIARIHDVFVLTDDHNRPGWERARTEGLIPDTVSVRFLRKKQPCSDNRLVAQLQSWSRYRDFNHLALGAALDWHEEVGFDLCHQVTIAAWRMPASLWKLPIPFVWGPVGGVGNMEPAFRSTLSMRSRAYESARDLSTAVALRSKGFRNCIENSAFVLAANQETFDFLKPYRREHPMAVLPIAVLDEDRYNRFSHRPANRGFTGPLRLFAGGNMIGTKGIALALRALELSYRNGIDFHYTVAGAGPEISHLKKLATKLGISEKVEFHHGYIGDDYVNALHDHEVYLLPSFRETMGVTLIEAIFAGLYPIVAKRSAQAETVAVSGGISVDADNVEDMVKGLADSIAWCMDNRMQLSNLISEGSRRLLDAFSLKSYHVILDHAYSSSRKIIKP